MPWDRIKDEGPGGNREARGAGPFLSATPSWHHAAKAMTTCPPSLTYLYNISTCQPTCRARSDADVTCSISFVPVDGCTCPDGTFLDDTGKCVPATNCPCYHGGSVVPNGESTHKQGVVW